MKKIELFLIIIFCCLTNPGDGLLAQNKPGTASVEISYARQLLERGENLRKKARFDSAQICLDSALKIFQKSDDNANHSNTLSQLSLLYEKRGDLALAETYINRAIDFGKAKLGTLHAEYARAISIKGNYLRKRGELKAALQLHLQGLEIRIQTLEPDDLYIGYSYDNLASDYLKLGDFQESLGYYEKALAIYKKIYGENHPTVATVYINTGSVLQQLGFLEEAAVFQNNALEIRKNLFSDDHPAVARSYWNLAVLALFQRDFATAQRHSIKAESILQARFGSEHPVFARIYDTRAIAFKKSGDLDAAIEYFQRAIDITIKNFGHSNIRLGRLFYHLGTIYYIRGQYTAALDNFHGTVKLFDDNYGKNYHGLAKIYIQIADSYRQTGDIEQSLSYSRKAIKICKENYSLKHPDHARAQKSLGYAFAFQENYLQAVSTFQSALINLHRGFNDSDIFKNPGTSDALDLLEYQLILNAKAMTILDWLEASGSDEPLPQRINLLKLALQTLELAAKINKEIREDFRSDDVKLTIVERIHMISTGGIRAAHMLFQLTGEANYLQQALYFSEQNKATVLRESLAELSARALARIPANILDEEKELRINLAYYKNQLDQESAESATGQQTDHLKMLSERKAHYQGVYDAFIDRLEKNYPDYYTFKYRSPSLTISDLQRELQPDEAILEYFMAEDRLYIFLITDNTAHLAVGDSSADIAEGVADLRRNLRKLSARDKIAGNAHRLYQQLIGPFAAQIAAKKRLIIIPDGQLTYLPFDILLPELPEEQPRQAFEKQAFLVRSHEIRHQYSANLWYYSKKRRRAKSPQRTFGGFAPVFSGAAAFADSRKASRAMTDRITVLSDIAAMRGNGFTPLLFSEKEVETISQLFEGFWQSSNQYIGLAASETAFKQNAGKYNYLHLATHSFMNESNPALSGIAFAPSDDANPENDGILYPAEIYNLELNADLVVLSSCESGLGKLVKGEGIMAMTRGFLYAGTPNIVVSLWAVADRPTSRLMVAFYQNIADGKSYGTSLRSAKLALLDNPATSHPQFWSSFILLGN